VQLVLEELILILQVLLHSPQQLAVLFIQERLKMLGSLEFRLRAEGYEEVLVDLLLEVEMQPSIF
jgi:hypothetical protein